MLDRGLQVIPQMHDMRSVPELCRRRQKNDKLLFVNNKQDFVEKGQPAASSPLRFLSLAAHPKASKHDARTYTQGERKSSTELRL